MFSATDKIYGYLKTGLGLWLAMALVLDAWAFAAQVYLSDEPPAPKVNPPDAKENENPETLYLPVFPGSRNVPMDGQLSTGGVAQQVLLFFAKASVDEVMDFYRTELKKRKLRITEHRFSPYSGYVGFYHTNTRTMRMATIQAQADGSCMIILSSMNPLPLVGKNMEIPKDLPSLPSAVNVVTTSSEQGGNKNRTVYFEAWGTPEQVLKELDERATKKGWKKASKERRISDQGLTLQKDKQLCIIRASASSNSSEESPSSSVTMVVVENKPAKERKKP